MYLIHVPYFYDVLTKNRKIAAWVFSTIAGVNAVFFAEYAIPNNENEPHVFTPIHQWVRDQKKRWLLTNNQHGASSSASKYNDNPSGQQTRSENDASANIANSEAIASAATRNNHIDNVSELRRISRGYR